MPTRAALPMLWCRYCGKFPHEPKPSCHCHRGYWVSGRLTRAGCVIKGRRLVLLAGSAGWLGGWLAVLDALPWRLLPAGPSMRALKPNNATWDAVVSDQGAAVNWQQLLRLLLPCCCRCPTPSISADSAWPTPTEPRYCFCTHPACPAPCTALGSPRSAGRGNCIDQFCHYTPPYFRQVGRGATRAAYRLARAREGVVHARTNKASVPRCARWPAKSAAHAPPCTRPTTPAPAPST